MATNMVPALPDKNMNAADRLLFNLSVRTVMQTALYPFEYGKTLIQLGYEPLPPWPAKNWMGKPQMMLPNIFQYVGYMRSVDGHWGMYRGVKIRITELIVGRIASHYATDAVIQNYEEPQAEEEEDDELPEVWRQKCIKEFIKDLAGKSAAVIASHPFHVCAVRCMAEFVGGESSYVGVFGSLKELYRENGISGFFSGIIPRLLAEVCNLALWHSLTYVVTTYIVKEKENRDIVATSMGFVASTCSYPFMVVAKCMCISGSGLVAAQPPNMPVFTSWIDCWSHLSSTNQLWRGSSVLLWRYDTRPRKSY